LGIGLAAFTLPVIVELAVLTSASLLPGKRRRFASPFGLDLAVIIPAHNEEQLIARAIKSVQASAGAGRAAARILVVAHNCSDQTAQRAAEAGAEVLIYDDPAAQGKGFALRYGFERAFAQGADTALVIDADSTVSENLIRLVSDGILSGAEAVQCRYEMSAPDNLARMHLAALALRGFNLVRPRGRERLGLSCGIFGNGFAIRDTVFSQVPYQALSLVEDLEYHIHLVLAGKRVRFLDGAIVSAELPGSPTGEATQRSRWEGGRSAAARRFLGPLAARVLCGHLRLIEPLLDLAGLPLAFASLALLLGLALPLGLLRLYFAAALAVVGFHVLTSICAGGKFGAEMRLLLRAPGYILWKVRLIPRLLRGASSTAAWMRTERAPAVRRP